MFSRGEFRGLSEAELGSVLDIERATIGHRSTRCGDNAAMPCPKGMAPDVEMYLSPRSVIFDFSNVQEPGTFADVDFEGFVLELAAGSETPILLAAIDLDATTLDVGRDAVTHDEHHLDVNFAGVSYDSDDFVKIDLLLGPLNLLAGGR